MMRNFMVIWAMMTVLFAAGWAQAGVCEIINGSFEDDGLIDDITRREPNGWDVNVPSGKIHNLYRDDDLAGFGTINFFDLAILADNWLLRSFMEQQEVSAVEDNGY